MNAVSPPPAGWYPDPSGRAPFRYWDGARWTEHTDQGTAPSPPAVGHCSHCSEWSYLFPRLIPAVAKLAFWVRVYGSTRAKYRRP